jgi:hypothetical protein
MTTENNKLIAEFLDNVFKVSTFKGELVIENIQSWKHYEDYDEIEFDFNLLMQVVEKIKPLNKNGNHHYLRLMNMTLSEALNIDYLYSNVVEFIKWYNENKI